MKSTAAERSIFLGWSRPCAAIAEIEKLAGAGAIVINHAHVDVRLKATRDPNLRKMQEQLQKASGAFGIRWWEGGAYLHVNLEALTLDSIYALAKECNFTARISNLYETRVSIPLDPAVRESIDSLPPFFSEPLLDQAMQEKAGKLKSILERRKVVLVARIREDHISILSRDPMQTSDVEADAKAAGVRIGEVTKP